MIGGLVTMVTNISQVELKREVMLVILRHPGRENAIIGKDIAQGFGFTDDRKIRLIIEELIDEGFPVCSATDTPAGYFFPVTVDEAKEYYRKLRHRGLMVLVRARKVVRPLA